MGMIWRSTMPLLSTLAALVIIVHSAEEEIDPGFRKQLRPRAVDPGPSSYEQPWKAIDADPAVRQSTRAAAWDESPEEPAAQPRPVRKRKRRPATSSEADPDERYRKGSQGSYPDTEYHDSYQTTELTRRRRKRPDVRPHRWADDSAEKERPLRRRGLRKKRPILDENTPLSELDHWKSQYDEQDDYPKTQFYLEENVHTEFDGPDFYDKVHHTNTGYGGIADDSMEAHNGTDLRKITISNEMHIFRDSPNNYSSEDVFLAKSKEKLQSSDVQHITQALPDVTLAESIKKKLQPKPLSEFSIDQFYSKNTEKTNVNEDFPIKSNKGFEKSQDYDPIDPYTLKQILKRSNGTSLSEILQRHNLSLTDLLRGKGAALELLNTDVSHEHQPDDDSSEGTHSLKKAESKYTQTTVQEPVTKSISFDTDQDSTEQAPTDTYIDKTENKIRNSTETERRISHLVKTEKVTEMPRMTTKRRFPTAIRRKLRMRPMLNRTVKAQLSRDMITLSGIKYAPNNRNVSKYREWKEVIPLMFNKSKSNDENSGDDESAPTTTETVVDTTLFDLEAWNSSYTPINDTENSNVKSNEVENTSISTTEQTTTLIIEALPSEINSETEKPKLTPIVRPAANNSTLRRQAFNNRLKRKRLKQQSSTTEHPSDDLTKNFYGMANLVSASQFIERTQKPHTTITQENTEYGTELEDFMTTQVPTTVEDVKYTRISTSKYVSPSMTRGPLSSTATTTEQSAKFEIDEILNDTMTSERLAKILQERNMTLGELVKHRERGSSHVHLADIFHNASKEPNPPEPFLTKSSIEPISKETYPLRAILEANTHDASTKPTTLQTFPTQGNYMHIPVVMDFGNNVNENGENIGIMSLFNKFTGNHMSEDKMRIQQDSDGTPYVSSVISVNTTNQNDTNRESRVFNEQKDLKGWKILLSLMEESNIKATEDDSQAVTEVSEIQPTDKSVTSSEDIDGDGLIILADLQHLKDIDSNIASTSDEKLDIKMFERSETITEKPGILNKSPNHTRSVAIATASILGLATTLFLFTYIVFKYRKQRVNLRKKDSFCDERIPSPVFEHRKGHKNNCSSRSISPMISNSNIYTMSTLDSHTGKESPDYMWNSLRKPFQ